MRCGLWKTGDATMTVFDGFFSMSGGFSGAAAYPAAALMLAASHALPSWPGVRPRLVAALGRAGFVTLYSLLSLAALALFVLAYRAADTAVVFTPPVWAAPLAVAAMPVAFTLIAWRLSAPFGPADDPHPPRGLYRITRAPGSLGLLLWAGLHLLATGDSRRLVLFATMAAIALFAIVKNGWVLRHADTEGARRLRAAAHAMPFATPASRRPAVWAAAARETGPWRPLAALAAWAGVLAAHPHVFGVDPLFWLP